MKKNTANWVTIVVFAVMIAVLSAAIWLTPDKSFSDNENRYLATFPALTVDNIKSGKFTDGIEDYLADQFWNRDSWTALRSETKILLQNKDIGGVYLCRDGYYIEAFTQNDLDEDRLANNLKYLQTFFAKCETQLSPERISFLLVPTPGYVLRDKLPAHAELFDQDAVFSTIQDAVSGIRFIDLREDFLAAKDTMQLYYHTDHHWTSEGALLAYQKWQEAVGQPSHSATDYTVERSEGFRGTLYSKVLDAGASYDTVSLYRFPGDDSLNVTYNNAAHTSCYDFDKLSQKNKYEVFFGGNYPTVNISGGAQNGRRLLVVKDSYANSFIPFAAQDYESITMIDLRYFLGSIEGLLTESQITDVLVLYSTNNFLTDQNMSRLALG